MVQDINKRGKIYYIHDGAAANCESYFAAAPDQIKKVPAEGSDIL